jgi:hypothetical protein
MERLTTEQLDHLARLIKAEVSFFNGCHVNDPTINSACFKAACKVQNYLVRKASREQSRKRNKLLSGE